MRLILITENTQRKCKLIGNMSRNFNKNPENVKPRLNRGVRIFFQPIKKKHILFGFMFLQTFYLVPHVFGQIAIDPAVKKVEPKQIVPEVNLSMERYLDLVNGTTADEAVRIALENNGEIKALRDELEAAKALITQARLRPNPRLQIGGSQEGLIGNRYSAGAALSLPLELGGRRRARVNVVEKQFKVREALLADSERKLAADVRKTFGESLAQIKKLKLLEELLGSAKQGYKLIAARVTNGSGAPLEQHISLVELNRIRSMRETASGAVEIKLLALRNIMGVESAEPLRLKGGFENLLVGIPSLLNAAGQAILKRPDLRALRLNLELGNARLEKARSEGRLDAGVSLGFRRMTRVTPRITNQNPVKLSPNLIGENFITFGIDLMVPVHNKSQGSIKSAVFQIQAAQKRIEFGELTVRREVAAAFTRIERASRALAIYQAGVRDQAKENLRVVWQTYEFGDKGLVEYIAEERRYLGLENELTDALLEVYLAKIEVYRAMNAPELITR